LLLVLTEAHIPPTLVILSGANGPLYWFLFLPLLLSLLVLTEARIPHTLVIPSRSRRTRHTAHLGSPPEPFNHRLSHLRATLSTAIQGAAMTVQVEATETTITALLERIEHGDEVQLLKNGQTVATLVPKRSSEMIAKGQAAMDRMDARAKDLGLKFDYEEFKADKESGRR